MPGYQQHSSHSVANRRVSASRYKTVPECARQRVPIVAKPRQAKAGHGLRRLWSVSCLFSVSNRFAFPSREFLILVCFGWGFVS